MYNVKWINLTNDYKIKIEIYGTVREIFTYDVNTKECKFYGSLDLKLNNDKKIYNEINLIKNVNDLNECFSKYNWVKE